MPELDGKKYSYTPSGIKEYYKDKKKKKAGKPSAKDDYVDAKTAGEFHKRHISTGDNTVLPESTVQEERKKVAQTETNPYYQTPTKKKVRIVKKGSPHAEMAEEREGKHVKKYYKTEEGKKQNKKFDKKLSPSPGRSLNGY